MNNKKFQPISNNPTLVGYLMAPKLFMKNTTSKRLSQSLYHLKQTNTHSQNYHKIQSISKNNSTPRTQPKNVDFKAFDKVIKQTIIEDAQEIITIEKKQISPKQEVIQKKKEIITTEKKQINPQQEIIKKKKETKIQIISQICSFMQEPILKKSLPSSRKNTPPLLFSSKNESKKSEAKQFFSKNDEFQKIAVEEPIKSKINSNQNIKIIDIQEIQKQQEKKLGQMTIIQLQKITLNLHNSLCANLELINSTVHQFDYFLNRNIELQAEKIKNNMYQLINNEIQKWIEQQMYTMKQQEFTYLSDLLEIQTRLQQRQKEIRQYYQQINMIKQNKINLKDQNLFNKKRENMEKFKKIINGLWIEDYPSRIQDLEILTEQIVDSIKDRAEYIICKYNQAIVIEYTENMKVEFNKCFSRFMRDKLKSINSETIHFSQRSSV